MKFTFKGQEVEVQDDPPEEELLKAMHGGISDADLLAKFKSLAESLDPERLMAAFCMGSTQVSLNFMEAASEGQNILVKMMEGITHGRLDPPSKVSEENRVMLKKLILSIDRGTCAASHLRIVSMKAVSDLLAGVFYTPQEMASSLVKAQEESLNELSSYSHTPESARRKAGEPSDTYALRVSSIIGGEEPIV